jgi:hypothetical protein
MSKAQRLYEPTGPGLGSYRILDSVQNDMAEHEVATLKKSLERALKKYPELNDVTVTVGKKRKEDRWYAEADWTNDIIFLPTHELCYYQTICHELSHLAINKLDQRGEDVPLTSEEFCSIFTVARMTEHELGRGDISYIGTPNVPKEEWPEICQRALEYRENHRNYIQKAKEWLKIND